MNSIQTKLNDLPELPFELIFSYLSLKDRIKARAVSRGWYNMINSFKVQSLCYSEHPSGFIYGKNSWIKDSFAQMFINSPNFEPFFQTFGQSILSNLKHLRLCNLDQNTKRNPAFFAETLNSFGQLEELGLFKIQCSSKLNKGFQLRLNLPMLKSIHFEGLYAIDMLTLDAPRLQKIALVKCYFELDLVWGESVEKLIINNLIRSKMKVKKLKNLKYLYWKQYSRIDQTLLSTLEQLNEIHLVFGTNVANLLEQKERYARSNLKIYFRGCLMNGLTDLAIRSLSNWNERHLVENQSKLTVKEIPLCHSLKYSTIEAVALGLEIDLLNKFTDLTEIIVDEPVRDVDRFLKLLKTFKNIVKLRFQCDQPQELFDRLTDHCAIQWLEMEKAPTDLNFLFKLKSSIFLFLYFPLDIEFIPKLLEELQFLWKLEIGNILNSITIVKESSKQFTVSFLSGEKKVSDVNAVVQWISEKVKKKG